MKNFAIIETGGKQYQVEPGARLVIEKIEGAAGETVLFDQVLLTAKGDTVEVGTPTVAGEKVTAKVVRQFRDKKKIVFRFHSKTRYRKKKGHRQEMTEVEIIK